MIKLKIDDINLRFLQSTTCPIITLGDPSQNRDIRHGSSLSPSLGVHCILLSHRLVLYIIHIA